MLMLAASSFRKIITEANDSRKHSDLNAGNYARGHSASQTKSVRHKPEFAQTIHHHDPQESAAILEIGRALALGALHTQQ